MLKQNYLKKNYEDNLKKFQYKCTDHSIFYKYISSPVASYCVDKFTPTWIAFIFILLVE